MSFHVLVKGNRGPDNDLTWKPQSHLAHALGSHYDTRVQDPRNLDENIPKAIMTTLDTIMSRTIEDIRLFCLGILNEEHSVSALSEFAQLSDDHLFALRDFIAECARHDGMTVLY